tara:strand:- start:561 stop:731 length:171 start_codon:yes stop_codon:yes gene_type:complete
MTVYTLRDRVYVGSSIGYFKFVDIETFEDRDLAYKELENFKRSPASFDPFITTTEQ